MKDDNRPRVTARRFVVYLDPRICPRCAAPASRIFGARRYCNPCASFLEEPTPEAVTR